MSSGALSEKKDVARNAPDPAPDKGDVYIWRCIWIRPRLRLANHLSKTREIKDAKAFLEKVASRLALSKMLLTSDKLRSYPEAILEVFGVADSNRPEWKSLPEGFLYAQIDKERVHGHLVAVDRKAVVGTMDQIQAMLDEDDLSTVINTSFVERDNLSVRQHNGRVVRKTLSYSKSWRMHQNAIDLEDAIHNFVRTHSSLRVLLAKPRGRCLHQERTPAMAAGLTDHIWTMRELVTYRPPPR